MAVPEDGWPLKAPVVGTPISLTTYEEVLDLIARRPADQALVIVVCNVHSVMSARRNPQLRMALDGAQIATPDGMPLVWGLRATARADQTRVYGPELMARGLAYGVSRGWTHYFHGATTETLDRLREVAQELAPGVQIAGMYAPHFGPADAEQDAAAVERISSSGADVVWVGLGMPKQELFMSRVREQLPGVALIGVGAAFDLLSGNVPQAPPWMQRRGLEWLYRLWKEPRRLWRRYVFNNPAFLVLLARDVWRHRGRKQRQWRET